MTTSASLFGATPGAGVATSASPFAGNLGGNLFGAPAPSPVQPATAASLFQQAPAPNAMFAPMAPTTTVTQSQFGMTPTTLPTQSQFGSTPVFGAPPPTPGTTAVFGAAPTSGLFGGGTASTQAQGFANVSSPAQPTLFGGNLGGDLFAPRG